MKKLMLMSFILALTVGIISCGKGDQAGTNGSVGVGAYPSSAPVPQNGSCGMYLGYQYANGTCTPYQNAGQYCPSGTVWNNDLKTCWTTPTGGCQNGGIWGGWQNPGCLCNISQFPQIQYYQLPYNWYGLYNQYNYNVYNNPYYSNWYNNNWYNNNYYNTTNTYNTYNIYYIINGQVCFAKDRTSVVLDCKPYRPETKKFLSAGVWHDLPPPPQ